MIRICYYEKVFISVFLAAIAIGGGVASGQEPQTGVGSVRPQVATPELTTPIVTPAPPTLQTPGPVIAPAAPVQVPVYTVTTPPLSTNTNNYPAELLAILQSVFGVNSRGNSTLTSRYANGCVGGGEIACIGADGNETYTTNSFANIRPIASSDLNSPFRILAPFRKYFDGCIQKAGLGSCRFVNLGIKGDASHQRRRSCHNSAQAIDVGPLTCSTGGQILASDPRYFEVAKCMANDTNNELQVIFYKSEGPNMIRKSDHNNHMHIQLKNCAMTFG